MKKLILIIGVITLGLSSCKPKITPSDAEYPIGTVIYIMPDSTKAVASGGHLNNDTYLWVQYTTKFGKIEETVINKQLIYKK